MCCFNCFNWGQRCVESGCLPVLARPMLPARCGDLMGILMTSMPLLPLRAWFAGLVLGLLGLLGPARAEEAAPLRICVNETPHFPWRLADAEGRVQRQGLDFVFLDLLAKRIGQPVQVAPMPWKRCISELKAGGQDAVFGISYLPGREALGAYPGPAGAPDERLAVRRFGYSWYTRRDRPAQWDGRQLTGLGPAPLVAAQPGFSIGVVVREMGFKVEESARTTEANLVKVMRGQADAAALQVDEADRVLAGQPALQRSLVKLEPVIQKRAYFVVFSHRYFAAHGTRALALWQAMVEVGEADAYKRAEAEARR